MPVNPTVSETVSMDKKILATEEKILKKEEEILAAEQRLLSSSFSKQNIFEFKLTQYSALRNEILELKQRVIHILTIGLTSIPVIIGSSKEYEWTFALVASPVITVLFVFMLIFEQLSLMRAGCYIKDCIEEPIFRTIKNHDYGWETWLELDVSERRKGERFFLCSALITFCLYYLGGTYLAYDKLLNSGFGVCSPFKCGQTIAAIAAGFYIGCFVLTLALVINNFPIGSTGHLSQKNTNATRREVE